MAIKETTKSEAKKETAKPTEAVTTKLANGASNSQVAR